MGSENGPSGVDLGLRLRHELLFFGAGEEVEVDDAVFEDFDHFERRVEEVVCSW